MLASVAKDVGDGRHRQKTTEHPTKGNRFPMVAS
jgi:hypothetical protein